MDGIQQLAARWLEYDQDPNTRAEVQALLNNGGGDFTALKQCMEPRIAFGTAGLRASMGAGFARMNGLVVIQTSQGLAQHLLDRESPATGAAAAATPQTSRAIVVGYDARHGSEYFARLAAAAFLAKGFRVLWLGCVHTPLVPFTVRRHQHAAGGVMITASHNPKQDNGYKVYATTGGQINQPEDAEIANAILENLKPLTWDILIDTKVEHVREDSVAAYNMKIADQVSFNTGSVPNFVYTPLHGVGFKYMDGAFAEACRGHADKGIMHIFSEQVDPDPNFTTVKYPNPEEDGALDLAKEYADAQGISLIIANDPDADRFAAAEKVNGTWRQFKGDEVGVLLGHYLFKNRKELDRTGSQPSETTMLLSAVSSQMLGVIGAVEGFAVEETLTGFKWIGNRAREIGPHAVFGYEEALGYMLPEVVFDKDGVATAMLFLEMCSRVGSPYARLQQLYQEFGYFETMNTYWKSPSISLTAQTVANIQKDPTMIQTLGADPDKTRVRDLMAGTDSGTADGKATLWSSPSNQMITVWHSGLPVFRDGVRYTVRASGTEPKIKVYIECRSKSSAADAREGATAVLQAIARTWFQNPELKVEERFQSLIE